MITDHLSGALGEFLRTRPRRDQSDSKALDGLPEAEPLLHGPKDHSKSSFEDRGRKRRPHLHVWLNRQCIGQPLQQKEGS